MVLAVSMIDASSHRHFVLLSGRDSLLHKKHVIKIQLGRQLIRKRGRQESYGEHVELDVLTRISAFLDSAWRVCDLTMRLTVARGYSFGTAILMSRYGDDDDDNCGSRNAFCDTRKLLLSAHPTDEVSTSYLPDIRPF